MVSTAGVRLTEDIVAVDRLLHPPVLLYHSVAELGIGEGAGRVVFERQMAYLARSGYRALTPAEFIRAIDEAVWPARSVFLTFDDGYLDFHEQAFPILRDAGLTATVFLVSDILEGRACVWKGPQPPHMPPLMSWSHVLEMRGQGVSFGSHGLTHSPIAGLAAPQLAEETAGSKAILEQRLGEEVSLFSYPYGDCDESAMGAVESAGYAAAFGVSPQESRRFEIFRRIVKPARTSLPFRLRVSGAYPPLRRMLHLLRGDS